MTAAKIVFTQIIIARKLKVFQLSLDQCHNVVIPDHCIGPTTRAWSLLQWAGKKFQQVINFNWLTNVWGNPSEPYSFILVFTFQKTFIPILFEVHFLVVFCYWDLLSLSPGYDRVSPVSDPEPGSPQYCDQFCFCPAPEPC